MSTSTSSPTIRGFETEGGVIIRGDGIGLRNFFQAGLHRLELHVQNVNNLNVFPVPDGDTGTNMLLTMQAAVAAANRVSVNHSGVIMAALADGALMGGRGNSGVILSQFLQGMARGLAAKATFTAAELAEALRLGADQAYQSVFEPVEGTILTVARAAAVAAEQIGRPSQDLMTFVETTVAAMTTAQADTPNLLPVLREAGVTDSGGQGLLYIFEGGLRFMRNEMVDTPEPSSVLEPGVTPVVQVQSLAVDVYDVQFLISGDGLAVDEIRTGVASMGESPLVVGSQQVVRVHLHTADPSGLLNFGAGFGTISQATIENMAQQSRLGAKSIGIVAVVSGFGFVEIFQRESIVLLQPVDGDALLTAVQQIQAKQVLILPNHKATIGVAKSVQARSEKVVQIVPTQTIPQGIAALLTFNNEIDLETNTRRMSEAAQRVRTIEVVDNTFQRNGHNSSTAPVTTFYEGEQLSTGQNFMTTTLESLSQVAAEQYELITLYAGQHSVAEQSQILRDKIRASYPEIEVELYQGQQAHYHYIISLE